MNFSPEEAKNLLALINRANITVAEAEVVVELKKKLIEAAGVSHEKVEAEPA